MAQPVPFVASTKPRPAGGFPPLPEAPTAVQWAVVAQDTSVRVLL
jgi:hypothetical protein